MTKKEWLVKNKSNIGVRLGIMSFMMLALAFSCSSTVKDEKASEDSDAANAQAWTITISGKVQSPAPGQISLVELKETAAGKQDTIQLKSDNTFSKKVTLTEPGYYRLNFFNKQVVDLILHKNDLTVNVDGSNAQGFFEVKGSPDLDIIREIQTMLNQFNTSPEVSKLNEEFTTAMQAKDNKRMEKLQLDYQNLAKVNNDKVAAKMIEKSPSLAVVNLLQNNALDKDQYFPTYEAVAAKLTGEWANYTLAKNFIAQVNTMRKLAVGQMAPEIALPDPQGNVVKLSSLRGKYVLIDFWAKWCGPCRKENPNVVRAFNQYKDKGFTVFGVSLDRSKEDWLKAIQEDGLTWTHVSDLKYFESEAAKLYNINAIPFSVLVDPTGKIIAKNLRGPALDAKLEEIFAKKKG